MRYAFVLVLLLGPGLAARAAEPPALELTDPGLPLWEIRPLDRHVYVLSLEGKWLQAANPNVGYYVNLLFPDGCGESHRVLDPVLFRLGEVRCVFPEYQLLRHHVARGDKVTIVVSQRNPATSADAPEVISVPFVVTWTLERPIVTRRPRTRFTPPEPIDAFPLPGDLPRTMPRAVDEP
jgi:hypothetical protein